MTNFQLRLVKTKGIDKTKRPAHKEDDTSESEKDDDEGFIESKFDYDEGVMEATPESSQTNLDV